MTETRAATPPQAASPSPAAAAPADGQPASLSLGLVDTPHGQRLAVQVTILLGAAEARQLAKGMADIASSMSSTGLVVASPSVRM